MPVIKRDIKEYDRVRFGKTETVSGHTKNVHISEKYIQYLEMSKASEINIKRYIKTHPDALSNARLTFLTPNEYWNQNKGKCDVLGIDANDAPEVKRIPATGIPGQVVKYDGVIYVANEKGLFSDLRQIFHPSTQERVVETGQKHSLNDKNIVDYFLQYDNARPKELKQFFSNSQEKAVDKKLEELHNKKIIIKDKNGRYRLKVTKEQIARKIRRAGIGGDPNQHTKKELIYMYQNRDQVKTTMAKNAQIQQVKTEIKTYRKLRNDSSNTVERNKELDGMIRAREHNLKYLNDPKKK